MFSLLSDKCEKKSDRWLICYVEIHTDGPKQFLLHAELTLRENVLYKADNNILR
jgi:hypothetical protein